LFHTNKKINAVQKRNCKPTLAALGEYFAISGTAGNHPNQ